MAGVAHQRVSHLQQAFSQVALFVPMPTIMVL